MVYQAHLEKEELGAVTAEDLEQYPLKSDRQLQNRKCNNNNKLNTNNNNNDNNNNYYYYYYYQL